MKIIYARVVVFLVMLSFFNGVSAQEMFTDYDELPGIDKCYKPLYSEDFPDWAKMLYQYPINYYEITEKFEQYTRIHGKIKNPIVRYFKIWSKAIEPYVQGDGTIELLNKEELYKKQRETQLNAAVSLKSTNADPGWSFLGPKETFWLNKDNYFPNEVPSCPWQVNVYSFDVAASNNNVLFCGTETGFVNKTTDKGLTWQFMAPNYVFGGGILAVAIHPKNPDVVYVSAGNQMHKTTDGGNTWNPMLGVGQRFGANRLRIDTNNPDKIIASSAEGLYISTNGGVSWVKKWSDSAYDIEIKPGDSNTIFGITKNSNNKFAIVVSTDGGKSFSTQHDFPTDIIYGVGGLLAVTPDNPDVLFVIMLSGEDVNGTVDWKPFLYKGVNSGGSWSWVKKATGETTPFEMNNGQGYFDLVLAVSPLDENIVLVGTTTLYKSTNGGGNFSAVGGYKGRFAIHPDMQDIKMLPNGKTWISTDGGMSLTTDNFTNTSNYSARINGIVGSDMWGFDQGWNEDIVVGGRYHNGNTAIADFYQDKALRMGGGESATGWVMQGKSRHVAFSDIGGGYILPKTASGDLDGRFPFSKYPNMDGNGRLRGNLLHHPNYHNTIYVGSENGFWRSTDMGASFDLLSEFPDRVRFMQMSFSNPDVIYADVVNNGLYKSSDGGITWTAKPTLTSGTYGNYTWKGNLFFVISPYDENVVYACVQNGVAKVFKTNDGGDTWEDWTGAATGYNKCLAIQPYLNGEDVVYLFTNAKNGKKSKVFYRQEDVGDWSDISKDYPAGLNVKMALPFYRDGKIRVGCSGGVWESPLVKPDFEPIQNFWVEREKSFMLDTLHFDDHSMLNHEGVTWEWTIVPEPQYISDKNIRNPKVVLGQSGSYDVTLTITKDGQTYSKTIEDMVSATTYYDCSNPVLLPHDDWTVIYKDSEESNENTPVGGFATNAIDGDINTWWCTQWKPTSTSYPHEIQIDLGRVCNIHEFTYVPRQNHQNGRIADYEIYISDDTQNWGTAVSTGTWPNTANEQKISYDPMVSGRYLRLKALSEVKGNPWTTLAEIKILGCYGGEPTGTNLSKIDESIVPFPVPTNGVVNFSLPSKERFDYKIYSLTGRVMGKGIIGGAQANYSFDLSSYKSGFYVIHLVNKGGVTYRVKVVRE